MRILYDGFIYGWQSAGGINRYFENLINRLPETDTPLLMTPKVHPVNFPIHANLSLIQFEPPKHKLYQTFQTAVGHRDERLFYSLQSVGQRFDLVHPTYYFRLSGRITGRYRKPVVLTIWDMIHERFPALDSSGEHSRRKPAAIEQADVLICISENTKRDLIECYKVPERKIVVTYLGSEIDSRMAFGTETVPERPYFLYVGSRAIYKNFDGFLRAFSKAKDALGDTAICVVGAPLTDIEKRLITDLRLSEQVEHYGYAADWHLAKLYRCSIGLVYPSRYEGFGIPPLEAMACGTAVITSNTSSLPEVVGDAGLMVNPESAEEIAAALVELRRNEAMRTELIEKGRERAKQFSWDKCATETFNVYKSICR